jgi:hypothetical protein
MVLANQIVLYDPFRNFGESDFEPTRELQRAGAVAYRQRLGIAHLLNPLRSIWGAETTQHKHIDTFGVFSRDRWNEMVYFPRLVVPNRNHPAISHLDRAFSAIRKNKGGVEQM